MEICGSAHYLSPEMVRLEEGAHDFPVDVWSMGITVLELLMKEVRFILSYVM